MVIKDSQSTFELNVTITKHPRHHGNQIFSIQMSRGYATIINHPWHHGDPWILNPHDKVLTQLQITVIQSTIGTQDSQSI